MPVEIQILNVTSTVHNVNNQHEDALDRELSFRVDGAQFSSLYRRGLWDGRKHLYKKATAKHPFGKFSTGLVSRVLAVFDGQFPQEQVLVTDHRVHPPQQHPLLLPGFQLHDYEQEAVNIAVERTRGLFRLPTGAGKSVVEAAIIAHLNVPTLVMSHRSDILLHLKEVVEKALGFEIGHIQGSMKQPKKFNVAMIQTIKSCFDRQAMNKDSYNIVKFIQEQVQCLIIDESHHSSADSYLMLANRAYNAFYRYGFSATQGFGHPEDMLVEAGFGKVQMSMTPSHLVKQRRLSKPYIFFVDYDDASKDTTTVDQCRECGSRNMIELKRAIGKPKSVSENVTHIDLDAYRTVFKCSDCGKEATTYSDATIRNLVQNQRRNAAIVHLASRQIKKGRTVLIMVTYIEHGKIIEEMLSKIVDREQIQFVYSGTEDRKDLLKQLKEKKKLCLIATSVFGEGVDIPELATLINARASSSEIDVMQVVGRALRRAPRKWKTIVFDFRDKSKYFKSRYKFRKELLSKEPEFVVRNYTLEPAQYNLVTA